MCCNSLFGFISGDLKTKIYSQLGVPVCRQVLTGWLSRNPPNDHVSLSSLKLPRETLLFLTTQEFDNGMDVDK